MIDTELQRKTGHVLLCHRTSSLGSQKISFSLRLPALNSSCLRFSLISTNTFRIFETIMPTMHLPLYIRRIAMSKEAIGRKSAFRSFKAAHTPNGYIRLTMDREKRWPAGRVQKRLLSDHAKKICRSEKRHCSGNTKTGGSYEPPISLHTELHEGIVESRNP